MDFLTTDSIKNIIGNIVIMTWQDKKNK
jgi:hypothetical protein